MKKILAILAFSLMANSSSAVNITKTGVISKVYQCVRSNGALWSTLEFKVDDSWFKVIAQGNDGGFKESIAQYNTVLSLYLAGKSVTITVPNTSVSPGALSCGATAPDEVPGTVYFLWTGSGGSIKF